MIIDMILNNWLTKTVTISYWVLVVYFILIAGLLLVTYILEWKYYRLKFNKEQRNKEKDKTKVE